MELKSTKDHYGAMIVSIHWVSALLIVILLVSGFRAAGTVDAAAKEAILRFHIPIAVAVLALTLLRIVWWWNYDAKPVGKERTAELIGEPAPDARGLRCTASG